MISIGIDAHKASWRLTAVSSGEIILALTISKPDYGKLKTVPGIGALSAMEILVELQDINRFQTAEELTSCLGLTPSQYSSGDRVRMAHITHAGNGRVRTTLVECCWILIWRDPVVRAKYDNIRKRRAGRRAITAIARKLSACIRRILIDEVPYAVQLPKAA